MMRHIGVSAAVAATALVLTACGSSGGSSATFIAVPQVVGVRTADGGRAVVVAYRAGTCHTTPKTRVEQTSSAVTVTASISAKCAAGGAPRAQIPPERSLGSRPVRNGAHGQAVRPFNGAVLTDPGRLPVEYQQLTGAQTPGVGGGWTRVWRPAPGTVGDRLEITQSPQRLPSPPGTPVPGRYTVAGLPAALVRDSATRTLIVQWNTRNNSRSTRVVAQQTGPHPTLTPTQLLAVAASLPTRG